MDPCQKISWNLTKYLPKIGNIALEACSGDIAQIQADAVIAPIYLRYPHDGIHTLIRRVAGDYFHSQLPDQLYDLQTVIAPGDKRIEKFCNVFMAAYYAKSSNTHSNKKVGVHLCRESGILCDAHFLTEREVGQPLDFKDVIFLIDDKKERLGKVIYLGLEAAHNQSYQTVSMPLIRSESNFCNNSITDIEDGGLIDQTLDGIKEFGNAYGSGTSVSKINLVIPVYNPLAIFFLEKKLEKIRPAPKLKTIFGKINEIAKKIKESKEKPAETAENKPLTELPPLEPFSDISDSPFSDLDDLLGL